MVRKQTSLLGNSHCCAYTVRQQPVSLLRSQPASACCAAMQVPQLPQPAQHLNLPGLRERAQLSYLHVSVSSCTATYALAWPAAACAAQSAAYARGFSGLIQESLVGAMCSASCSGSDWWGTPMCGGVAAAAGGVIRL
jgi:hypothetical protein